MRIRTWIFAAVVAIALAVNLGLVSLRIAQTGEDTVRARVALASNALKAQLELIDARLMPRAAASAPELVEATRAPADPTQPLTRPDDKALRAAANALVPEPDLLAVLSAQGAIVSRRSKPAQGLDDAAQLPLGKQSLEGAPAPSFASWDGATWRVAASRVPGNAAAVIDGMLVDDRFASQLKSQVDADVTLLMGGKVVASSLPQGDERARVLRWAAAPGPGYGVAQVRLPLIGTALSGKLPRGASRYAVRGALVQLDGGVQAALTVPASPYLGWLARYQAFYLVGLFLFVLFGFFWGLFSPRPLAPVAGPVVRQAPRAEPRITPRPAVVPSLVGTDVGQAPSEPPPPAGRDVPWSHGEGPSGEHPKPPSGPRAIEPLDPEVPPPPSEEPVPIGRIKTPEPQPVPLPAPAQHPMWSADPFSPTPAPEPVEEPAAAAEAEPPLVAAKEPGDFSFAGLLDEAHGAPAAQPEKPALLAQDYPDTTAPGQPSAALLAESRPEAEAHPQPPPQAQPEGEAPFPGDEPTRIEPVSAALLDKLRERDAEDAAQAAPASLGDEPDHTVAEAAPWGALLPPSDSMESTQETPPPEMAPAAAAAAANESNITMSDFSLPAAEQADPDEEHWRDTFEKFRELKQSLGEPADKITFEKFSAKLRKNREDLIAKHSAKGVRFVVYSKDGKAAIKASAIR